jgi:PIN domain nuclease of toxin-antitoxin system
MRALLDTHVFLWWVTADPRLSPRASDYLTSGANVLLFSVASGWELAIKAGLGRLAVPGGLDSFIPEQLTRNAIDVLPVQMRHALFVASVPALHRDPFDRLLVAQAILEQVPLLTADERLRPYPVETIW